MFHIDRSDLKIYVIYENKHWKQTQIENKNNTHWKQA